MTSIDLSVAISRPAPEQGYDLLAADGPDVTYVLRAPAGQVWDALTDAEKFGFWFGAQLDGVFTDAAELTGRQVPTQAHPGLGRAMKPCLGTTFVLSVDQFEPNQLLAFRWQPVTDATDAAYPPQTATLVSFALAAAEDITNLTVTESALRDDPRLWRPRELAMLIEKFLSGARDLRPGNPRGQSSTDVTEASRCEPPGSKLACGTTGLAARTTSAPTVTPVYRGVRDSRRGRHYRLAHRGRLADHAAVADGEPGT